MCMYETICGKFAETGGIDTGTDYMCVAPRAHSGACEFVDASHFALPNVEHHEGRGWVKVSER